MTSISSTWVQAYLQAICAHPHFGAAVAVAPLWLAHEGSAEPTAQRSVAAVGSARVTIQMAAEMFPRMALVGPAGAGKTTLLRQLARVLAEAIRAEETQTRRVGVITPLPLYIELAQFESIEASLGAICEQGAAPMLGELARERPLLLLLDGLEELAPEVQLAALSTLAQTLTGLGTQARWIASCRPENLALFRPWLGAAEVRSIRPLPPRDVIAILQRHCNDAFAAWIEHADDLISLATRARWLAGLMQLDLQPPFSRGRIMAEWLAAVLDATVEAHPALGALDTALAALPALAAALDQHHEDTLTLAESNALIIAAAPPLDDGRRVSAAATIQLLLGSGILTFDSERRKIAFCHPVLRSFAQALLLIRTKPDTWPAAIFAHAWHDTVIFAYSLCDDREVLLQRLLSNGAVQLAARCLIDTEPLDQFETLLDHSGTITPPLRVMLAEAFATEGLSEAARDQLERAGMEGYDEAGLFGRLGELYSAAGQWNHARAAYEQALARDPDGLRYQQELGVVYSRLGAMNEAATALQAVLDQQQRRSAAAAYELGHIYIEQGQLDRAVAAYQQAVASRPDEPAYQRGVAGALRRMGRLDAAETILRKLLDEDSADALAYAELGRVYEDAGRREPAIVCYTRAITLQPDSADCYYQIGRLRRALGDLPGARAALQRAAELDLHNAALHFTLGQVCEEADEPDNAIAAYRYAAQLDGQHEACLRRLGALLRDRGDDEEAAQALRGALDLRPDSAETQSELAALLWRQGQHDQALELYERVIALAPQHADYEHALGMAYRQLGRLREAFRHLTRAADIAPDRADLHYDAATTAESLQDWAAALSAYERAVALEPARLEYIRTAGALHLKCGNQARARALLATALWRDRRDAATLRQVGLLHAANAAWLRAIPALRRAVCTERSVYTYDQLGRALNEVGRPDEACEAFEQALRIQPVDPGLLYHYSLALSACGKFVLAYDFARQATHEVAGEAVLQHHAGELALRLGRLHEALALFDQAVALDSTLAAANLGRGQVLLGLDQPTAALAAARTALSLNPSLAAAALLAGQAAVQLGRPDAARSALEQAIGLDASLGAAHILLRDLLDSAGDRAAALVVGRRAAELAPVDAGQRLRLGELLIAEGELPAAIVELELALQLDPNLVAVYARLGQVYARTGAWERARDYAQQASAIAPADSEIHALLAQALVALGDLDGARVAYAAACAHTPDRADWPYALGELHRSAGDHQAALPFLQRAVLIAPDRAEYRYAIGCCLRALGDRRGAVEALEQALRIDPQAHAWRVELAELHAARGWHGEALAELNRAISAAPENARFWRMRAELHLHLEQPESAQADLIEALGRDPHDQQSFALLARVLIARNHVATALDCAQRAVGLAPDNTEYRRLLAQALRLNGRRAEAAEQLGHALVASARAEWWVELADDYEALDLPDRARDAWDQTIALTPDDPIAHYRYGCLLARLNEMPAAAANLRTAIVQNPSFAAAHAQLADLFVASTGVQLDAWAMASSAIQVSFHSDDRLPITLEDALKSARCAVALQPEQSDYWRILGALLQVQGAKDEATHALRRAHELDHGNAQAAFLLGIVALETDAKSDAVAAFGSATAMCPNVADYHGHLALAYRRRVALIHEPEDLQAPAAEARLLLDRAHEALIRAVELDRRDWRWWCELGVVEQLLGRHDAAIAAFDRSLQVSEEPTIDGIASAGDVDTQAGTADDERVGIPLARRDARHVLRSQIYRRRALSLYMTGRLAEARADQEAAIAQAPADVHDYYLLGRIACELGDFAQAETALAIAVTADAANAQAQFFLGRTLLVLERATDAIVALERAAELCPDHAQAVALLSQAYTAVGRHERALVAAARAVRIDSGAAEHHQRLSSLYAASGRLNEARAALINAMTLRPDVAEWHAQMGEICLRLRMNDAALNAYSRAVQLAPAAVDYLYTLARLQAQQGRTAEARATMEQAVAHSPDCAGLHYELGQIQEQLGEDNAALEHYAAALQHDPGSVTHWHALALAQRQRGTREFARETVERALERFGSLPALHAAAGALLGEHGDQAAVAWHYSIAVESEPRVVEHWWRLGRAQLATGDTQGARAALERALALAPDTVEGHAGLAQLFAQQGETQAALVHIQRAAEIEPGDFVYQTQLAETFAQLRRFDDAYEALRRALELAPDDPEALARYGEMALNVERNHEALDAFERAAALQPEESRYHFLAGKAHRRLKHYSRAIERYRRAVRLRPGYSEAIIELSTLGPLAFVARYLRGADQDAAA